MTIFWAICLSILAIIIVIGIIRIIITQPTDFFDALCQMFWMDMLIDSLSSIVDWFSDSID